MTPKYFPLITVLTILTLTACQSPAKTPQERRELCEHFAGEEPYDAERASYLNHMFDELKCDDLKP